jgi:predicted ATPase
MYESFEVRNFRCFRDLQLGDLRQVNLIAGKNNVGKTALLEALFLHAGANNPQLTLRLQAFRGLGSMSVDLGEWVGRTVWDSLFEDFDTSRRVQIVGQMRGLGRTAVELRVVREGEELATSTYFISGPDTEGARPLAPRAAQVLDLTYEEPAARRTYRMIFDDKGPPRVEPHPPPARFQTYFQTDRRQVSLREDAELFSRLRVERRAEVLVKVLRIIEPDLDGLDLIIEGGEPVLHGDTGKARLIALPLMGGGILRLAGLILRMGNAPSGVMLIDEIENGLHHSALLDVWRAVGQLARDWAVQVFATTHSLECAAAAHTAFAETMDYDFRLHRLERVDGEVRVTTYDRDTLEVAIESGLEVR